MADEAVALIRDVELYEHVERQFASTFHCRLRFASCAESALALLREQRVPTLLIDSRSSQCDAATQSLVEQLLVGDAGVPAIDVLTVGDNDYPRAIAAPLWLLALEHLPMVGNAVRWETVAERLSMVLAARRARPLPARKHIEAGGIHLTTYCQAFFPTIDDLLRVAHRDVTLLLIGETGTGKTTLARLVHNRSPRRERTFQHLACGALPADLIESELFGHTRGAFTGAERNKIGRFQAAGQGTLLLDEIDVLDLKQQVKLLRVIETGEYELVGSTETRVSEARLIVASNVELEDMTERAEFRSDLYYRLNVLEFRLPALRDRQLDIAPLALQFVDECSREHGVAVESVSRDFLAALGQYRWPGNLRELKNHMRRAVLFSQDHRLSREDLSPKVLNPAVSTERVAFGGPMRPAGATIAEQIAQSERDVLQNALAAHGQNRTRTAEALGLSRVGLYKKLKRLGLMSSLSPMDG